MERILHVKESFPHFQERVLRRFFYEHFSLGSSGNQKKSKAILALELRLKIFSARFENNEIDRKRYLEGLSLFVPNKK